LADVNDTGKVCLAVSLTPVRNSSPASPTPVSDAFTVLESFTSVNHTPKPSSPENNDIEETLQNLYGMVGPDHS
jgi:ubiquitin-protein ligase